MKKISIILLIIIGIASTLYFIHNSTMSESDKINKQMSDILHAKDVDATVAMWKYNDLKLPLASAYNNENKPDQAIELLTELIKENHNPPHNIYGQERRRISADYYFEARYYEELAKAFGLKGNKPDQEKALKKGKAAQAIHDRLAPLEEAQEKKMKERERSDILN